MARGNKDCASGHEREIQQHMYKIDDAQLVKLGWARLVKDKLLSQRITKKFPLHFRGFSPAFPFFHFCFPHFPPGSDLQHSLTWASVLRRPVVDINTPHVALTPGVYYGVTSLS